MEDRFDIRGLYGWVASAVGSGARIVAVTDPTQAGEGFGPWRFEVAFGEATLRLILHVGLTRDETASRRFDVHRMALEQASASGIPAPRLVATDEGEATGYVAILQTVLSGSSHIPERCDSERLRALGRALASIHDVVPDIASGLPRRSRSLEPVDFSVLPVPERSADLFARAREMIDSQSQVSGAGVFVHGDFWQGNTLWEAGEYCGAIDWDCAGIGSPGIDLGSLRCDVAIMYGPSAADYRQ